jgi:hypothetical protein
VIGSRTPAPDGPERSPVMLAPPPRRGAGVRRLNRMPLVIGFGGACAVAAAIGYTYHERAMQAATNAQRDAERKAEPASGAAILSGAPPIGEVRSAVYRPTPSTPGPLQPEPSAAAQPSDRAESSLAQGDDDALKARRQAWQNYYAQLAQLQKDRLTTEQSAMMADTSATNHGQSSVSGFPAGAAAPTPAGIAPAQGLRDTANTVAGYGGAVGVPGVYGTGVAGYPIYPPAQIDTAGQREKQAFLAQPGATTASDYLQASMHTTQSRPTR